MKPKSEFVIIRQRGDQTYIRNCRPDDPDAVEVMLKAEYDRLLEELDKNNDCLGCPCCFKRREVMAALNDNDPDESWSLRDPDE